MTDANRIISRLLSSRIGQREAITPLPSTFAGWVSIASQELSIRLVDSKVCEKLLGLGGVGPLEMTQSSSFAVGIEGCSALQRSLIAKALPKIGFKSRTRFANFHEIKGQILEFYLGPKGQSDGDMKRHI